MTDHQKFLLEYLIIGLALLVVVLAFLLTCYGTHILLSLNWFLSAVVVINSTIALIALGIGSVIATFGGPPGKIAILLYIMMLVALLAGAGMKGASLIVSRF